MARTFPETLSALRRAKKISQRQAASELGISQALLSHYENGTREPGLSFVCRVCDYYGVSTDYILCRTDDPNTALTAAKLAKELFNGMRGLLDSAEAEFDKFDA